MAYVLLLVMIGVLGAVTGSFVGAQVWRVRARQLVADKAAGESVDAAELRRLVPLTKQPLRRDRSRCLSCRQTLAWHDLVPVLSWLRGWGRCRYCRAPIGWTELLLELVLAAVFVGAAWMVLPATETVSVVAALCLGLWLSALGCLAFLFVYDSRWYLLPDRAMAPLVAVSLVLVGISWWQAGAAFDWFSLAGAIAILSGSYALLYVVSRGQWIGFGDVKLTFALALLLADWQLAFLALFAANLIGTLMVMPGLLRGTLQRQSKIPFGPLLIIGFLLAWLWGRQLISWYLSVVM